MSVLTLILDNIMLFALLLITLAIVGWIDYKFAKRDKRLDKMWLAGTMCNTKKCRHYKKHECYAPETVQSMCKLRS